MSSKTCPPVKEDIREKQIVDGILSLTGPAGITFFEQQAHLCAQHVVMMLMWNKQSNLTRITDINEILSKHLLDSLIPARWLPNHGDALDVGTGAGFPGVPLKVIHPELTMVLLDAQRKKVSFLKVLLAKLRIGGITCAQGRWQDYVCSDAAGFSPGFDLLTLRALRLEPDELAAFAATTLRVGGIAAWWIGSAESDTSLQSYNSAMNRVGLVSEGCLSYELPLGRGVRRISIWKKVG